MGRAVRVRRRWLLSIRLRGRIARREFTVGMWSRFRNVVLLHFEKYCGELPRASFYVILPQDTHGGLEVMILRWS
jgi:hypothetical protein